MSMMTHLTHYDFCSLCLFMHVLIWVSLDNSAMMLLFLVSPHFCINCKGETCGAWDMVSSCLVNHVVVQVMLDIIMVMYGKHTL